jgi:hypothetical protein
VIECIDFFVQTILDLDLFVAEGDYTVGVGGFCRLGLEFYEHLNINQITTFSLSLF